MTETLAPVIVDARGLMPPQPMHLTLEALDTLPAGGEVILLLYREPTPLYDVLIRNGRLRPRSHARRPRSGYPPHPFRNRCHPATPYAIIKS